MRLAATNSRRCDSTMRVTSLQVYARSRTAGRKLVVGALPGALMVVCYSLLELENDFILVFNHDLNMNELFSTETINQ